MKLVRRGDLFAEYSVGDARVISLSDGHAMMRFNCLVGVDFSKPGFAPKVSEEFPLPVQAFFVEISGQWVLIDSGSSNAWRGTTGRLYEALTEAGIARDAITAVAITHCHVDHINGLVMPSGEVAFPNASRIFVPSAEHTLFKAETRLSPVFSALRPLQDGDTIVESITAMATHGHEVGHTSYWIASRNEKLLVWGDIVHKPELQFDDPAIAWEFDTDQIAARQTRQRVFELVAREQVPVAGAHLDFPGIGLVGAEGTGYRFSGIA
jgi:glyoxylase-like metal-dependent hydrolase (beta-lactamase superfamily II)